MGKVRNYENIEDRYEVLNRFGDGGYGDLYVGRDRSNGRTVAVKAQKPWRSWSPTYHAGEGKMLLDEGGFMSTLSDVEGIPELLATGTYRGDKCLVMEYIEGRTLRESLEERLPLKDVGTVASVIGQLCEILWDIHEARLVHCDLKPENVIVEPDGRLRLIDMGRAVPIGEETEDVHGTPGYASDSQLEPSRLGLTERADIFGLGCMLLEMTVQRLPYGGLERRVREGHPALPPERHALVPVAFRDLALRMVAWEPEDRPGDVREVFDGIRPHLPAQGCRRPAKPLRPDPTEYYRSRPPRL